jgi:hypothetical protein
MPGNTYDAFSWIYAVRQQDLTPGTTTVYYIYDGWKLSRATSTVSDETEDILVGEEFDCRRVSLEREVLESRRLCRSFRRPASFRLRCGCEKTRAAHNRLAICG